MRIITKDSEAKLLEMSDSLKDYGGGYSAIHFYFSRLEERFRSEFQMKIAVNIVHDLLKSHTGAIFLCSNYDMVVIFDSDDKNLIEKVIYQLRYLFSEDPLAYIHGKIENELFCSVYLLAFQWRDFALTCKKILQIAKNIQEDSFELQQYQKKKVITPNILISLEKELDDADISHIIRTQPVCVKMSDRKFRSVFQEYYVSISHLKHIFDYDVDLTANKNLFRYLTEILDKAMLNILKLRSRSMINGPMSINLNISSIFTDHFTEFDAVLSPEQKSQIIIELNLADIFNDLFLFNEVKTYLKHHNYKICMDGLDYLGMIQVDRNRLGFDLAKLYWNEEFDIAPQVFYDAGFEKIIENYGPNRLILARCDSKTALDYGGSLKVSMFQGWYVDKVMKLSNKMVEA